MKIVIVGSLSFVDRMRDAKAELEEMGHEVTLPSFAETDGTKEDLEALKKENLQEFLRLGRQANLDQFESVRDADAILVINLPKHGIDGYIGANTLMEMTVAFEHRKKIFVLNDPSSNTFAVEELEYIAPISIRSDLSKIT